MNAALARRLLAEFIGTGLLVAVVVGSGIAATRLTSDGALRLLVNSVVTALGLAVLIVVFLAASGAHFNPVVTAADWILGRRTPRRYSLGQAAAVVASQVAGAIAGAALADAMFAEPVLSPSHHHRGGAPVLLSEVVATAGLLFVIVALVRTGRIQHVAWAVGAWIGAAYWFTASTAFANPAVTIGRTLTSTYAGIAPVSAPAFIAAQLVGGVIGTLLAVAVYPARPSPVRADPPAPVGADPGAPVAG
jgi:glycerol uptake facilitator-like aquaporin